MSIIEKALRGSDDKPRKPVSRPPDERGAFEQAAEAAEFEAPAATSRAGPGAGYPDQPVPDHAPAAAAAGRGGSDSGQGAELQLDFEHLQSLGFLTPVTPRSRAAEEFRTIKRPLLRNIEGRSGEVRAPGSNLVMVTSALQGDGKTFCSINLAVSIAMERDTTVLFVDADVVRAVAGKTLGVPAGAPGLIDLLEDTEGLEPADVIMRTNIDNLRILPAGNASDKSTELLASATMRDFMIELSNRYPDRVIVFDSPPLLLTTEASVLASFMGQIVFIASADVTPQAAVREALEHIGEDKMVGVVLNRASRRRSKLLGIGSYGYGYGYGQGYSYGADREPHVGSPGTA